MTVTAKAPKFLRMDLQHFAEPDPADNPTDDPIDDPKSTGGDPAGEDPKLADDPKDDPKDEPKTFTQDDLDRIVKERLEREKKKRDDAVQQERDVAERKRLEEQGEYKELADSLQKQLDEQKADALKVKKESLLTKAGYDDDQIERYVKYLDGETDDELNSALETLKSDVPPKKKTYADPSPGNGQRDKPKKTDLNEKGKSMYQRLKEKGKLR